MTSWRALRMTRLRGAMMAGALGLAATVGCMPVEPAPDDVDGLMHFLWREVDKDDDALLADAFKKLARALDADGLKEPRSGSLRPLAATELVGEGLAGQDPRQAAGVFIATVLPCTPARLEALFVAPDQKALFPDLYTSMSRTYDGDIDAFLDGRNDTLSWQTSFQAKLFAASYDALVRSRIHRVRREAAVGDVARAFFARPAHFASAGTIFDVNLQVEAFVPRASGDVLHVLAQWTHLDLGALGSTHDDHILASIMGQLRQNDQRTAELCAEPAAKR